MKLPAPNAVMPADIEQTKNRLSDVSENTLEMGDAALDVADIAMDVADTGVLDMVMAIGEGVLDVVGGIAEVFSFFS